MDNSNTYAVMEFIGEKLSGGSWKGGEDCEMGAGLGRGKVGESSVPGGGCRNRGIRDEKIPTGTRSRLWNAKRMLNSCKTSLSTVGFQGPLRKVFALLPRAVCRSD